MDFLWVITVEVHIIV